jgi:hypothetical protein
MFWFFRQLLAVEVKVITITSYSSIGLPVAYITSVLTPEANQTGYLVKPPRPRSLRPPFSLTKLGSVLLSVPTTCSPPFVDEPSHLVRRPLARSGDTRDVLHAAIISAIRGR